MTQHAGEETTGTRDEHYNPISGLYHALQGAETSTRYIEDAERAGDRELAQFFRDVQQEDATRAQRAEQLLAQRFPGHQR